MPGSREEAAAGACAPSPRRLGRRGGARPRPARARSLAGWLARSLARSRRPEASPACAPGRSHSGACARGLGPTRVAGFPRLQGPPAAPLPAPGRPVPPFSSRNGAGAARGRAPWTRLALGLALSAAAWLAPPCAFPQSVAPKAPLSGGRGSCFRFFLSLRSRE